MTPSLLARPSASSDWPRHQCAGALLDAGRAQAGQAGRTPDRKRLLSFVSLVVLMELYWGLSKLYGVTLAQRLDTVDAMLNGTHFFVEQRDVLRAAASICATQKPGAIDALIAQLARASSCAQPVLAKPPFARRV